MRNLENVDMKEGGIRMQTASLDPVISIIIPCYNVAEYLLTCLRSIEAQTMSMEQMDIIFADDASTDATMAIIKDFADRHKDQVTVLQHKRHAGPGAAKNLALSYAQGKYVMFLNGEDCLAEDACERMVTIAEKNGLDILQTSYKIVSEEGEELVPGSPMFGSFDLTDDELRKEFLVRDIMTLDCKSKLFSRDMLVRARSSFAEGVGYEETKFVYPLFLLAGKVGTSKQVTHLIRWFAEAKTDILWERNLWFIERPKHEMQLLLWLKQHKALFETFKDEILFNFFRRFYLAPLYLTATTDAPITGYDYEWMRITLLDELKGNENNPYMNGGDLEILIRNLGHSFMDDDIALENYLEQIKATFSGQNE